MAITSKIGRTVIHASEFTTKLNSFASACKGYIGANKLKVADAMLHAHLACRYDAEDCFSSECAEFQADELSVVVSFSAEELKLLKEIAQARVY